MGQPLEHIEEIAREESRDYPYPGAATIRQLKAARSFVAATADPETLVNVFVARNEQWADVTMLSAYPAVPSTIEAVKAILRGQNPKIPQIPGLLYTLHEIMAAAVQAERDKNQSELTAVARTLDTLGPLYPTASARIEEAHRTLAAIQQRYEAPPGLDCPPRRRGGLCRRVPHGLHPPGAGRADGTRGAPRYQAVAVAFSLPCRITSLRFSAHEIFVPPPLGAGMDSQSGE